jgi:Spy/CpxP family protein refolding chaperone
VNTWKVILATIVIFVAGAVTGSLLVRNATLSKASQPAPAQTPPRPFVPSPPGLVRVEFLRRAERELRLTRDQREQIDKLISASQERTRKLMEPVQPKIREELQQTKDQFVAVLTPEQRVRFEELLKQQRQQQMRPRESHRPGRPQDSSSLPNPTGQPAFHK